MKVSVSSTALTAVSRQRIVSYPKKSYPNLNRVLEVFWPSFFRHMNFYVKKGTPWLVFDLPSLESGAPWYWSISYPCTHFEKSHGAVSSFWTNVAPCTADVAPCGYRFFGRSKLLRGIRFDQIGRVSSRE